MNFYDKKVRRLISVIILVVILAMVATMVIPYLIQEEAETHRYLKEYAGFDARQLRKMTHLEKFDGKYLLFDYRNRSRLSQNAATYEVCFSNE